MNKRANSNGFTLVEVLVVLLIIGLVISAAASLQRFGWTSFTSGTSRADMHRTARMIDDIIGSQSGIRNAGQVGTGSEKRFHLDNGKFYYGSVSEGKFVELFNGSPADVDIEFSSPSHNVLTYEIVIQSGGATHVLTNSMFLNNVTVSNNTLGSSPISINGTSLHYSMVPGVSEEEHDQDPAEDDTGSEEDPVQDLAIGSSTPPSAQVGISYSHSFTASGGVTPYAFTQIFGNLPDGLTLSSSGILSGTPISAGTFDFQVRVTDDVNDIQTRNFSIVVSPQVFTISFDSAGGSAVEPITQAAGTTISAPAEPTRAGYTFDGWQPALPSSMPEGGLGLVAQWTEAAVDDPAEWEPNNEWQTWNSNRNYSGGDKVTYNGNRYIARHWVGSGLIPGTTIHWMLQPLPGEDYPRWSQVESYPKKSHVLHNGLVYRAAWWADPGEEPGVVGHWHLQP